MILFFISLILITLSSYFITSILCKEKDVEGVVYLPLLMFSQIIFNFEILSFFTSIKKYPFLLMNILFLLISVAMFYKLKSSFWRPEFKKFFIRFYNSLKLDKLLIILFIGYCFFIFVSIFLNIITPVTSADGVDYHVARSAFWINNKSLQHYYIPDIRHICFPINSEILYAWVILFTEKLVFLGMFSFVGYILAIVSIFNIMSDYCYRKRLWVIFILSSLPSVIIQVTGTETDVLLAGLVCASVFLFKSALSKNDKIKLYMASLAYAIAIGTKTPAIFVIPVIGIMFLIMEYQKTKNKKFKNFLFFILFGIINFLVFSLYNYVLNFIDYGNIMGSEYMLSSHKNYYGLKGAVSNFIKHCFRFLDFTAFKWGEPVGEIVIPIRDGILKLLRLDTLPDGIHTSPTDVLNTSILEPMVGCGVIGIITFIPCVLSALLGIIFDKKKKTMRLFLYSVAFFVSLFILSYFITFMTYNVRFITFFVIIFAPLFVLSYDFKKISKFIVIGFAMFYFTVFSVSIWARPFYKIVKCMYKNHESISYIRSRIGSGNFKLDANKMVLMNQDQLLVNILKKYGKKPKILVLFTEPHNYLFYAMMNIKGYNLIFGSPETLTADELKSYDYILLKNGPCNVTTIINFDKNKNYYKILDNGNNVEYTNKDSVVACFYVDKDLKYTNTNLPYKCFCYLEGNFMKENFVVDYEVYGANIKDGNSKELEYVIYKPKKRKSF